MATYSGLILSGSVSGKPIPVAAIASPGTPVHAAVAGATGFDEIYLYAANVTGTAATLTIQFGGTADPADMAMKQVSIPANSAPIPVLVGQRLNGGLSVLAFSGTAGAIVLTGLVNRVV